MGLLVAGKNPSALKSADRTVFTATAGQTTFTVTQGYQVGDIDVFLNGLKLNDTEDYLATNGSTIVLNSAANAGDSLAIVGYNQFLISSSYTKTESDNRYLPIAGGTNATAYIRTPNYGISSYSDSASASLEANVGLGEQGVGVKAFGRSVATNGGDILYTADSRGAGGRHRFGYWNGTTFTNTMNIDSSGRVTMPSQVAFHAKPSTNVSVSAGNNKFIFNTTRFNIGGHYNTSNGRFTAPVSGTYLFTFQMYYYPGSTSDSYYGINLFVNGSNVYVGYARGGYGDTTWGNGIHLYLNANEYVEIYTYPAGATTVNTSGSYLTGHLVG